MSVRTKEELMSIITNIVGDRDDEEVLSMFDDLADTLDELTNDSDKEWKEKYEENDKMWRERYKKRFLGEDIEDIEDIEGETKKITKYEELFVKEEK